ncbi:hypothetical protein ACN42_g2952 [Penicillium freii]|uniref:Uncharacterized protein n=1 Tax=Penicillium freii TaxID=48697 RepID=A0A101MP63_PENFR|nr:hypothetical protein ACN42_g2952 [Penicillium freii]
MGSGKGLGLFLRRLLILVSGWDLVMRVYSAVFLFLLFHTSNYCIASFWILSSLSFPVSFAFFRFSPTNTVFQMRSSFTSVWMVV